MVMDAHLRRRLKSVLLVFGFALFVVMAVLSAQQASDPKQARGRHTLAAPSVTKGVPVASADTGASARNLPVDSTPVNAAPAPSAASAADSVPSNPAPASPKGAGNSQSAALTQALALSSSLRSVTSQQPAAGADQQ